MERVDLPGTYTLIPRIWEGNMPCVRLRRTFVVLSSIEKVDTGLLIWMELMQESLHVFQGLDWIIQGESEMQCLRGPWCSGEGWVESMCSLMKSHLHLC